MKIMLDLETLSSRSNAAIASIGAVAFTENEVSDQKFYIVVDPASVDSLFDISASTFAWWCTQSDAAREIFKAGVGKPLADVLTDFSRWCATMQCDEMWGNGADFDCVILGHAYEKLGIKKPWSYSRNRCFRTLKNLGIQLSPGAGIEKVGTAHNALDDALYQAHYAVAYLKQLKAA